MLLKFPHSFKTVFVNEKFLYKQHLQVYCSVNNAEKSNRNPYYPLGFKNSYKTISQPIKKTQICS
jgi:hypothetical protein